MFGKTTEHSRKNRALVACIVSVSVGFSVRLKQFPLFGRAKIGARAKKVKINKNGRTGREGRGISSSPLPIPPPSIPFS